MKKRIVFAFIILSSFNSLAQNVGIGTTTPGFPLNFANTTGDKISLYGNNGSHYGFGIQGGLLQIHSDAAAANIAFGYGSSGAFTERAKIINQGEYGMTLRGRLQLQTGTQSAGHWLTNMANTINAAFIGMASDNQVGFFGGTGAQWGLTMNTTSGNVGIGNNAPNVPLAFAPALAKKITLYPGATGDVGFGVAGNRLQIYSDNPNADVAIGYDAAGVFNERFAVKPTGALALTGNTGSAGQMIVSGGSSGAQWAPLGSLLETYTSEGSLALSNTNTTAMPAADLNLTITRPTKVLLWCTASTNASCTVVGPCFPAWHLNIVVNGIENEAFTIQGISQPGALTDYRTVGPVIIILPIGFHTISFTASRMVGQAATPLFIGLTTACVVMPQ